MCASSAINQCTPSFAQCHASLRHMLTPPSSRLRSLAHPLQQRRSPRRRQPRRVARRQHGAWRSVMAIERLCVVHLYVVVVPPALLTHPPPSSVCSAGANRRPGGGGDAPLEGHAPTDLTTHFAEEGGVAVCVQGVGAAGACACGRFDFTCFPSPPPPQHAVHHYYVWLCLHRRRHRDARCGQAPGLSREMWQPYVAPFSDLVWCATNGSCPPSCLQVVVS